MRIDTDTNFFLDFRESDSVPTRRVLEILQYVFEIAGRGKLFYPHIFLIETPRNLADYVFGDYFYKELFSQYADLVPLNDDDNPVFVEIDTWCYDYDYDVLHFKNAEDMVLVKLIG